MKAAQALWAWGGIQALDEGWIFDRRKAKTGAFRLGGGKVREINGLCFLCEICVRLPAESESWGGSVR